MYGMKERDGERNRLASAAPLPPTGHGVEGVLQTERASRGRPRPSSSSASAGTANTSGATHVAAQSCDRKGSSNGVGEVSRLATSAFDHLAESKDRITTSCPQGYRIAVR